MTQAAHDVLLTVVITLLHKHFILAQGRLVGHPPVFRGPVESADLLLRSRAYIDCLTSLARSSYFAKFLANSLRTKALCELY